MGWVVAAMLAALLAFLNAVHGDWWLAGMWAFIDLPLFVASAVIEFRRVRS